MRFFAFIGVLAVLAIVAGAVYFFGGFYDVSAIGSDNKYVGWLISQARIASIKTRAPTTSPVNLDDPATIQAGARAFAERGCVTCHGEPPGADWAKFAEGMSPDPADLEKVAKNVPAGEIFWVIKNGINMTGMPSFERIKVGDPEIWDITAFVKKFPTVSPEDYKNWTKTSVTSAH
jgi:mono/diheme cytochrome c family protein